MKAELRIGNYVNYKTDGYYQGQVRTINHNSCNITPINSWLGQKTIKFANIQPVLLTEDWLIKFGFVKASLKNCYYKTWGENGVEDVVYEYHYKGGFEYELGPHRYKTVESVHQLQNLFFALTGQELTIKSDNQ